VAKFVQLVREDLEAHDGDWTRAGFQALLVYRFGVWRMSVRRKLFRAPLSVLWRALFAAVRNFYGIELPFTARIGRRVIFEHQHGIVVHGNTEIGDDCIIRQGVTLGIRRLDRLKEAPVLGKHVNVGAGAKILGYVLIGDHAEIGANAVVLENVPPYALAIGVPAHNVIRDSKRRGVRREAIPRSSRAAPASTRTSGAAANGPVSNAPVSNAPGSTLVGNRPH
jgi:serine O-acetyltransferase